jgi:Acetyl-CoA carboxylase, carboxyltransferase component (subunits alpha and beta)
MSNVDNAELLQEAIDIKKDSTAFKRIASLFDVGSFTEVGSFAKSGENYTEAVAGFGTIEGCPAYVFAQNSEIDGGAMSKAQAAKINKVYSLAVKTGAPVIGIYDSIGGRLNEGSDLLAAYGEVLLNANNASGVVPQISIVLGPCIGASAMIAAGADIVIMSDKAELTVQTNGEGGSSAEAAKLGLCHIEAGNEENALAAARQLIAILPSNNLSGDSMLNIQSINRTKSLSEESDFTDVISTVCDENTFIELGKKFGEPTVTGFGEIGGSAAGIVALNGEINADACAKAARFVRFCDAFSLPVVTFVNAEKFTSLREASKLSSAYSEATTAKVTVITGSAYGPVYIAAAGSGANADYTMAWPNAVVSQLSPDTAAVFLWNQRLSESENPVEDRKKLIEEYKTTEASPFAAAANGYIDDIILPQDTRTKIISNLEMLSGKRTSRLPKKHSNIQL